MYDYKTERPWLFTDEGQRDFLKVRDKAFELSRIAGAFTVGNVLDGVAGDSWHQLACVDRLVELGEFRYLEDRVMTQNKVMVRAR